MARYTVSLSNSLLETEKYDANFFIFETFSISKLKIPDKKTQLIKFEGRRRVHKEIVAVLCFPRISLAKLCSKTRRKSNYGYKLTNKAASHKLNQ